MTTQTIAKTFAVEAVDLCAPLNAAFDYIRNPLNLPEWTHAFKSVHNGHAIMETPNGNVEVALEVRASEPQGTIDWYMKFPDGNQAVAYSRLAARNAQSTVYSFVLLAPPVSLEQLEGTLSQQTLILREELRKLEVILRRGNKNGTK